MTVLPPREQLLEMLQAGLSQKEIADQYGVTRATVSYHLRRHGPYLQWLKEQEAEIERRNNIIRWQYRRGCHVADIVKWWSERSIELDVKLVYRVCVDIKRERNVYPYKRDDIPSGEELHEENKTMSLGQLADKYGCHVNTIIKHLEPFEPVKHSGGASWHREE